MVYSVRFIYHPITLTVTAISPNHIRPRRVKPSTLLVRLSAVRLASAVGAPGRRSPSTGRLAASHPRGRPHTDPGGNLRDQFEAGSWLGVPPKRETHPAAPYIGPVVGAPDETGNMPDNVVSWTWHHSERAASPACDGIGIPKLAVAHSDLVAFEVCPQTRSLHTVYRRDALCCHVYAPV